MRYQNRTLVVFRYLWETTDDEHSEIGRAHV